jgi:hypothetical protein
MIWQVVPQNLAVEVYASIPKIKPMTIAIDIPARKTRMKTFFFNANASPFMKPSINPEIYEQIECLREKYEQKLLNNEKKQLVMKERQ